MGYFKYHILPVTTKGEILQDKNYILFIHINKKVIDLRLHT